MPFEIQPGLIMTATDPILTVTEGLGPPAPVSPTTIIRTDQAWSIKVDWTADGLGAVWCVGGQWTVSAYVESVGGGVEQKVGAPVNVAFLAGGAFTATINVGAGVPGTAAGEDSTPYLLVVTITFKQGALPRPMAAYQSGQIIQFYKP